jgi:hypothetical protein
MFLCVNLIPLSDQVSKLVTNNLVTKQVKPTRKEVIIQNMVLLSESTQIIYF